MKKQYYLDSNAHEPLNLSIKQLNTLHSNAGIYGNPMSPSIIGQKAASLIENSREKIAELLGATSADQIIFTHSCTESNFWANKIIENKYKIYNNLNLEININISPFEHKSMLNNTPKKFKKKYIKLDNDGNIEKDTIVSNYISMYVGVQNEIGLICNFKEIKNTTLGCFVCDMAQAPGKFDFNITDLDVDIATFGAHKFGGACGVGILYLKNPSWYIPLYEGGQYNNDIPGSPNVFGIASSAIALENSIINFKKQSFTTHGFISLIETRLKNIGFEIIAEKGLRVSTTTLLKVPSNKGLDLLLELSNEGIHVGLGTACGSMVEQPFNNIKCLGYSDEINTSFIRISCNANDIYNEQDAIYITDIINKKLKEIQ